MSEVRLPRLLTKSLDVDGVSLKESARLHPISMPINLDAENISWAEMDLKISDNPCAMHDFVELYTHNGSVGVFRVVRIRTDYDRDLVRLRLNAAPDMLNDVIVSTEYEDATEFTPTNFLTMLLSYQRDKISSTNFWTLGTVEDTQTYSFKGGYFSILEGMKSLADARPSYQFVFDYSTFPWTINFVAKNSTVLTEFRLSRNIQKCNVEYDDSELCTKLYLKVDDATPVVYQDTAAQAVYGIVEKAESIDSEETPDAQSFVTDYFAKHGKPTLSVSIDGYELKRLTGVGIDEVHLGRCCRAVLKGYNAVFEEQVVCVQYPDALGQPDKVVVNLSDKPINTSSSLSSIISTLRSQNSQINSQKWSFRAQDEHITEIGTILHEAGLEIDAHGIWSFAKEEGALGTMQSQVNLDAEGITSLVEKTGINSLGQDESLFSLHQQNASGITTLVSKTGINSLGQNETLYSKTTQTAEAVTTLVTKTGINNLGQNETLYSEIQQNATEITQKVSAGDVASTINQTAQSVLIQAQKINLSGYVTASQLSAEIATLQQSYSQTVDTSNLYVSSLASLTSVNVANNGSLTVFGHSATWQQEWVATSASTATITYLDDTYSPHTQQVATGTYGKYIYFLGRTA